MGLGFRIQGLIFGVWGLGRWVLGLGFRIELNRNAEVGAKVENPDEEPKCLHPQVVRHIQQVMSEWWCGKSHAEK